jgi:hypothetical protein
MAEPNACANWLRELRRLCGLSDADQGVEWRGESFYWVPASAASPGHVTLYVWVAAVGDDVSAAVLRQLFWLQLQSVGPCTPVFGCEPGSGQLVIAQAIAWQEMPAVQALSLMGLLADLAAQARQMLPPAGEAIPRPGATQPPKAAQRPLPRWWLPQPADA